jgi:hypothetical protein
VRLREIALILQDAVNSLQAQSSAPKGGVVTVKGFKDAIVAAERIAATGVLEKEARSVLGVSEFVTAARDQLTLDHSIAAQFTGALEDLRRKAEILGSAITEFVAAEPEDAVAVRLPPADDLATLGRDILELDKALGQLVHLPTVGGDVKLGDVDRGSLWLTIILGHVGVALVAQVVRLVFEYRERSIALKVKEEALADVELQREIRDAIAKTMLAELERLRRDGVLKVASDAGIMPDDNESMNRIKYAVKSLEDLMERGLEIHPTLMAPPEQRALFPPQRRLLPFSPAQIQGGVE